MRLASYLPLPLILSCPTFLSALLTASTWEYGWGRNVSVCAWNLKDLMDGGIVLCINCLRDARSD